MKKIKKRYPILAAILLLIAGYFGWYENDKSWLNPSSEQITQNSQDAPEKQYNQVSSTVYTFRNQSLRNDHYEKHGIEMGFASAEEYEKAASAVVTDSRASHKTEKENGDDVYYIEETNEFVIVSTDGYIRTYFYPRDGVKYFERQ